MDDIDGRIVGVLEAEPRVAMTALARRVGVSVPTVRERVRRLEADEVIQGFRVDIDPAALGMPIAAYVRVRPGPGQLARIAELAVTIPQVSECHRITGEDCFLMKVHATDLRGFEQILDQFLLYGQTTTSIVQSSPVPPRLPHLPESR